MERFKLQLVLIWCLIYVGAQFLKVICRGESGKLAVFLTIDLKMEDTFSALSTLAGEAIILLSWDVNWKWWINAYVQILTYYKGMQSGQIASLAGLFGRDSWVIWPICYFDFWGRKLMLWASKLPRQQWRLFCTHLFRLTPFRARFWTLWLRSGLNEFNIFLMSSQLDFLLPCTQSCINIVYYERTYIFSLRRRTYNL